MQASESEAFWAFAESEASGPPPVAFAFAHGAGKLALESLRRRARGAVSHLKGQLEGPRGDEEEDADAPVVWTAWLGNADSKGGAKLFGLPIRLVLSEERELCSKTTGDASIAEGLSDEVPECMRVSLDLASSPHKSLFLNSLFPLQRTVPHAASRADAVERVRVLEQRGTDASFPFVALKRKSSTAPPALFLGGAILLAASDDFARCHPRSETNDVAEEEDIGKKRSRKGEISLQTERGQTKKAGELKLSLEEELRNERQRRHAGGIATFAWDNAGRRLLLSNSLGIWSVSTPAVLGRLLRNAPLCKVNDKKVDAQVLALRNPLDVARCFRTTAVADEAEVEVFSKKRRAEAPLDKALSSEQPEYLASDAFFSEVGIHPSGRAKFCPAPECVLERKTDSGRPPMLDCTYSPTGELLAFVEGRDLCVGLPDRGAAFRLTLTKEGVSCGVAEYIAQEEMNRMQGYWWSPCGRFIAFAEFEDSRIPPLRLQRGRLPVQQVASLSEKVSRGSVAEETEEESEQLSGEPLWRECGLNLTVSLDEDGEAKNSLETEESENVPGPPSFIGRSSGGGCFSLVDEEHRFPFAGNSNVKIRLCVSEVPPVESLRSVVRTEDFASSAPHPLLCPASTKLAACTLACVCGGEGRLGSVVFPVSSAPFADWGEDFYLARCAWISPESWTQLVELHLVTAEELPLLRRNEEIRQAERGSPSASPPPVLVSLLQCRSQKQMRICVSLPVPVKAEETELRSALVFAEENSKWVALHDDFFQLDKSLFYTWTAERSVFNEVFLQHLSRSDVSFRVLPQGSGLRVVSVLVPPQNYGPFFRATRGEDLDGKEKSVAGDGDEDLYLYLQVIPQVPEECGQVGACGNGEALNACSRIHGPDSPLSTHVVCVHLARSKLLEVEAFLKTLPPTQEKRKVGGRESNVSVSQKHETTQDDGGRTTFQAIFDLNCAFRFLSNPRLPGRHSATICRDIPLWLHHFHSVKSPRQTWVRFLPNPKALFENPQNSPAPRCMSLLQVATQTQALLKSQLLSSLKEVEERDKEELERRVRRALSASEVEISSKAKSSLSEIVFFDGASTGSGNAVFEFQMEATLNLSYLSALRTPVFFSFRKGRWTLLGCYYSPGATQHGPPPYRAVVSTYGGPLVQFVANSWELLTDGRAQSLARLGLLVVKTDNRGSYGRSVCFEKSIHRKLGEREASDQAAACLYLKGLGLLRLSEKEGAQSRDEEKSASPVLSEGVGVYGVSYGGFLSAFAFFQKPEVFSAAFSGAPVTFWEEGRKLSRWHGEGRTSQGYSTHYTERYLEMPQHNAEGYRKSSVLTHVKAAPDSQPRKLLLLHGAVDENVHLQHSFAFIDRLIAASVPFEFVCLPSSRHGPSSPVDRRLFRQRLLSFFADAFLAPNKRPLPPRPAPLTK